MSISSNLNIGLIIHNSRIVFYQVNGQLVSLGGCNVVLSARWLKTTGLFSHSSRGQESAVKVGRATLCLRFWQHPSLPLSRFRWLPGIPWLVAAPLSFSLHLHMTKLPVSLCPNFLFISTQVIRLGPTLIQYDPILTWWHLQGACFQIRSRTGMVRVRPPTYLF